MWATPENKTWFKRKDGSMFHALNGHIDGKKVSLREWVLELQESEPIILM